MKSRNTEQQTSLKPESRKMKHAASAQSDKMNHKSSEDLDNMKRKTGVDSEKVKQKLIADWNKTNHRHSGESDKAKTTQGTDSDKTKLTSNVESGKQTEEKSFLKESLLLPSTSTGKTVSSSICEKSNVWAAHKLDEKKHDLDQMLYRTIVKLNTNRLDVVSELANLRKSSSTGNLNRVGNGGHRNGQSLGSKDAKFCRSLSSSVQSSPLIAKKTQSKNKHDLERQGSDERHPTLLVSPSHKTKSVDNSPAISPRLNHGHSHSAFPALTGRGHHRTIMKKSDNPTKVAIRVGSDGSSDESGSTDELDGCDHHLSLTHGQVCRTCMDARSKSQMVENVTRRYAKQLSAKGRNDK